VNDEHEAAERTGAGLWVGVALGVPVIVFGIVGLLHDGGVAHARTVAIWAGALLVVHDAVLVPVVLAVVWVIGRVARPPYRDPVRATLLASGLAVALAWPGIRGVGNLARNPTVHPFDTTRALVWVLIVVWLVAGAWVLLSSRRPSRRSG
jgi:hypothetical protein